MATIKGDNLRILVGDDDEHLKCIAASTSCQVHLSLQVEEDTTKDDDDDWIRNTPVGINWDASVDALVIDEDEGAHNIAMLQIGREYVLRFSRTLGASGQQNRDAVADQMQLTGNATLVDLNITASDKNLTTATAKFTGNGDLTPYTYPPSSAVISGGTSDANAIGG